MEYQFIQNSVDLLKNVDDFDEREFRGCSESQIEALEELLPEYSYLPESYYEFLKFGGNGICNMLKGTNFYFPQIYNLRKGGKIQNLKNEQFFSENFDYASHLTDDLFLLYFHQGYFARFFYLDAGSDPSIYYYEAGQPYHFLLSQEQSFSEYFYTEVSAFVARYQEKIPTVDMELLNRVKSYRHGILNLLERLEFLSASEDKNLFDDFEMRYIDILEQSYSIFDYAYFEIYEYSYVFSQKGNFNSSKWQGHKLQELVKMMSELEKEGKELVSYVRALKMRGI